MKIEHHYRSALETLGDRIAIDIKRRQPRAQYNPRGNELMHEMVDMFFAGQAAAREIIQCGEADDARGCAQALKAHDERDRRRALQRIGLGDTSNPLDVNPTPEKVLDAARRMFFSGVYFSTAVYARR